MIGKFFLFVKKGIEKCIRQYEITLFKTVGNNVYFGKNCTFSHKTISLGDNVYFGNNCVVQSVHGEILIGNHVMFGPGVNIHGGNHKINQVGIYMDEVTKEYGEDPNIIIEDDVWIGANAIVLAGVHIHTGAVIGAGSVIIKDVPAYAVVVGNPGSVIKYRFDEDTLKEHKTKMIIKREDLS